jgi:D-lyxose ketol-isomerase
MKRSEINRYISEAAEFFARHGFHLPPFGSWTARKWSRVGREADEIRTRRLGWDITDFGSGDFARFGLTLFTIRNGRPNDPKNRKVYAEKIMMVREQQLTPLHFHWLKTEDIINRGAGRLICQLFNSTRGERPGKERSDQVSLDGVVKRLPAGGKITLEPGQSVTLVPGVYHLFYARKGDGPALVGEVSSINDDATDNRFHEPLPRYPAIEEDEPAKLLLLCHEYPRRSRMMRSFEVFASRVHGQGSRGHVKRCPAVVSDDSSCSRKRGMDSILSVRQSQT